MGPTSAHETANGVIGTREYALAIRTEHMLVMAVLLAGAVTTAVIELRRGREFEFNPWWAIGVAGLLLVGMATGLLQRIWHLRIVLTPTELIAPAAMTRTMTTIPRASITSCRIVPSGRGRSLIIHHRHGQLVVPGFRLPSDASLDEIYENLSNAQADSSIDARTERALPAEIAEAASVLEFSYVDYINWPVAIGASILTSILLLGAVESEGHRHDQIPWFVAGVAGLGVLVWLVFSTSRWKGRIVVTQSTLSTPAFRGSKAAVAIPLSSITQLDVAGQGNRNRKLIVRYSAARIEIPGRCLATAEAFDQLHAALAKRRETTR